MIQFERASYQFTEGIVNYRVHTNNKTIADLRNDIDNASNPFDVEILDIFSEDTGAHLGKYIYLKGSLYKVYGSTLNEALHKIYGITSIIKAENAKFHKIRAYEIEGTMHLFVYI